MILDLVMIAAGLVLLVAAGDALVKGAVNLSLRLGVPALIVGLTVVAFGTSAPELLVSIDAVLDNAPALALGNVVGSNIANILLVLGVPALIAAVPVSRDLTHDFLVMMAASVLFVALAFLGPFGWPHGLALLAGLGAAGLAGSVRFTGAGPMRWPLTLYPGWVVKSTVAWES